MAASGEVCVEAVVGGVSSALSSFGRVRAAVSTSSYASFGTTMCGWLSGVGPRSVVGASTRLGWPAVQAAQLFYPGYKPNTKTFLQTQ